MLDNWKASLACITGMLNAGGTVESNVEMLLDTHVHKHTHTNWLCALI